MKVNEMVQIHKGGGLTMEYNAKIYTQNESKINGRGVWHYLIDTPIGQIHVIGYENP